uniref:Putative secreted protein n=1 Tax=Anopheles marajoara TaxID=58244 RepID=A0A2M4CE29_9DIPT
MISVSPLCCFVALLLQCCKLYDSLRLKDEVGRVEYNASCVCVHYIRLQVPHPAPDTEVLVGSKDRTIELTN